MGATAFVPHGITAVVQRPLDVLKGQVVKVFDDSFGAIPAFTRTKGIVGMGQPCRPDGEQPGEVVTAKVDGSKHNTQLIASR